MSDNLRVTTPITTNDSINRLKPSKEPSIVDVINPAKVTSTGKDGQTAKDNSFDYVLNHSSVFTKFVQQLRQTPALNDTLQKIIFDIFSRKEAIDSNPNIQTVLKQLSSGITMDKAEILKNLLFQQENKTKFSGPVFQLLKNISLQYKDTELDLHLANFLKAYDSFFSTTDTTKSIVKNLETIEQQIPKTFANQLKEAAAELNTDEPVKYTKNNLMILKEKIIPLLSQYVTKTNDFGKSRDSITLLVHNLARLNISSKEDLVSKFDNLLDYCKYNLNLPADKINLIKTLFAQTISKAGQKTENQFYDSMVELLASGSKQSSSNMSQTMFKDACTSLLLDNSVYMPFHHLYLPINFDGQFMFTEIWVEKEDDKENSLAKSASEKSTKMYLTFDIKELGYFEAIIEFSQLKANVSLNCPPSMQEKEKEVSSKISQIFQQNGITAENVMVFTNQAEQVRKQILQKVYERRNSIDVTI